MSHLVAVYETELPGIQIEVKARFIGNTEVMKPGRMKEVNELVDATGELLAVLLTGVAE